MVYLRAFAHGSSGLASFFSSVATGGVPFYETMTIPLAVCTAVLAWSALPTRSAEWPKGFGRFMASYLGAWTLCVAADWLQGPYVYALYEAYGYSQGEIAQLFVAGFGSAMLSSCFVGGLADRFGRKKGCVAYCCLYILSCATKHWKNYSILMLGRVTGGFATSLLFSCFECWMVSEHTVRHQFSQNLLNYMFGMKFTLMYLVAITSGFLAQAGVSAFPFVSSGLLHTGGNIIAFDMSALVLMVALAVICLAWEDNYGASEEGDASLREVWSTIRTSAPLMCLCLLITCFEGSMYCFVFNWTPSLETPTDQPPHGVVFALMMMACMCGASTTTLIAEKVSSVRRLQFISVAGVVAFCVASLTAQRSPHACFLSFLLFEFCVGIYFPSVGTLKSELVEERMRATVYNICRVPLNGVVVSLLLTNLSATWCFRCCALLCGAVFLGAMGLRDEPELSKVK